MNFTIVNAKIVLPDDVLLGSVQVENGTIVDVSPANRGKPGAIDLGGDWLIPGLVELHTDNLEKHFTPRPQVRWDPVSAAIAHDGQIATSGITTVYDALALVGGRSGADRRETLMPMVQGLREAAEHGLLRADHMLHLRCEVVVPDIMDIVAPFRGDPLVRFVSLMDHTPGQRQFTDLAVYRRIYGGLFGYSDAELDAFIDEQLKNGETYRDPHRAALATWATSSDLPLASHDDETTEHVAMAVGEGAVISEFPTTVDAAEAARENGLSVLMGAPNLVRGGSHSGNVSAGELAEAGLVDILSSDYVPIALLNAAMMLTSPRFRYSMPDAVATVTRNPAKAAGLDDRGEIVPGRRADLLHASWSGDGLPAIRQVWREGQRVA